MAEGYGTEYTEKEGSLERSCVRASFSEGFVYRKMGKKNWKRDKLENAVSNTAEQNIGINIIYLSKTEESGKRTNHKRKGRISYE